MIHCNNDCLNCSLPECKHDLDDQGTIDELRRNKKREYDKHYIAEHKEELKQKHRAWYEANREKQIAKAKARYRRLKNERETKQSG